MSRKSKVKLDSGVSHDQDISFLFKNNKKKDDSTLRVQDYIDWCNSRISKLDYKDLLVWNSKLQSDGLNESVKFAEIETKTGNGHIVLLLYNGYIFQVEYTYHFYDVDKIPLCYSEYRRILIDDAFALLPVSPYNVMSEWAFNRADIRYPDKFIPEDRPVQIVFDDYIFDLRSHFIKSANPYSYEKIVFANLKYVNILNQNRFV